MEKLAKIYKITNKKNGMVYIGSTMLSLEERWKTHLKHGRKENREGSLYDDIRKQPESDFEIELLDECFERHRFIIEEYWCNKFLEEGYPMYNIKIGNYMPHNTRQRIAEKRINNGFDYSSEEFKSKISEKTSGKNNGMYGKKDENAVNGRMVIAYDDNKNPVHIFPSVKMALKFLGIKGHNGLTKACRTGEKYYGYYWKKEWINR